MIIFTHIVKTVVARACQWENRELQWRKLKLKNLHFSKIWELKICSFKYESSQFSITVMYTRTYTRIMAISFESHFNYQFITQIIRISQTTRTSYSYKY